MAQDRRALGLVLRAVRVLVTVLAIAYVVRFLLREAPAVLPLLGPATLLAVAVAVAVNAGGNMLLADTWGTLLGLLNQTLSRLEVRRIWLTSQLSRYSIGTAQLVARPALAAAEGVTVRASVLSLAVETVMMSITSVVCVLAATAVERLVAGQVAVGVTAAVGSAAASTALLRPDLLAVPIGILPDRLRPRRLRELADGALRERLRDPRLRAVSARYLINVGARVVALLSIAVGLGAVGSISVVPAVVMAFLLGNLAGRLALFAPAGIGPREAVIIAVLDGRLPSASVAALLLLTRIAEMGAELVLVGIYRRSR